MSLVICCLHLFGQCFYRSAYVEKTGAFAEALRFLLRIVPMDRDRQTERQTDTNRVILACIHMVEVV